MSPEALLRLAELRTAITQSDDLLLSVLATRNELEAEVAELKFQEQLPISHPEVEEAKLLRATIFAINQHLSPELARTIIKLLLKNSNLHQQSIIDELQAPHS